MMLLANVKAAALFWTRRPLLFLVSVCLDVLFVMLYGFLSAPFRDKLVEHFVVISTKASSLAPIAGTQAVQTGRSIIAMLLTDPTIVPYTWSVVVLLLLLALSAYVCYVLANGVLWHFVHANIGRGTAHVADARHSGQHLVWHESVARFASLNIWWGLIAALGHVLSLGFALRASLLHIETGSDLPTIALEMISAGTLFSIVWWSYGPPLQHSGWRGFVAGVSSFLDQWRVSLPVSAAVLLPLVAINYAIVGVAQQAPTFSLIVGGILFFSVLSWARALFVLSQGAMRTQEVKHVHA